MTLWMVSCLSNDKQEEWEYERRNLQINSLTLKHEKVSFASKIVFTIDQRKGEIFNLDSLPYGTKIESKLVATVGFASSTSIGEAYFTYPNAEDASKLDTVKITKEGKDSVDFAQPVTITVKSVLGENMGQKNYKAWINIHQVQPDSIPWNQIGAPLTNQVLAEQKVLHVPNLAGDFYYIFGKPAGESGYSVSISSEVGPEKFNTQPMKGLPATGLKIDQLVYMSGSFFVADSDGGLYVSADGINWTKENTALPVVALLGVVKKADRQPLQKEELITMIVKDTNGENVFAIRTESGVFTTGEKAQSVPATFPISAFANSNYNSMHFERLIVGCGKDRDEKIQGAMWVTVDGLSWATITNKTFDFLEVEGASMAYYDDMFYLVGGMDAAGKLSKEIYISKDKGINWTKVDSLKSLPESYEARTYATLVASHDKFLMIFGGKTSMAGNHLDEMWKGRINRLGFKQ